MTSFLDRPGDPPLGVAESFHAHESAMEPGAMLILYTDGLVERRTESITVGLERLRRACGDGPSSPDALCTYLCDVMLHDSAIMDDVAILAVSL